MLRKIRPMEYNEKKCFRDNWSFQNDVMHGHKTEYLNAERAGETNRLFNMKYRPLETLSSILTIYKGIIGM